MLQEVEGVEHNLTHPQMMFHHQFATTVDGGIKKQACYSTATQLQGALCSRCPLYKHLIVEDK